MKHIKTVVSWNFCNAVQNAPGRSNHKYSTIEKISAVTTLPLISLWALTRLAPACLISEKLNHSKEAIVLRKNTKIIATGSIEEKKIDSNVKL